MARRKKKQLSDHLGPIPGAVVTDTPAHKQTTGGIIDRVIRVVGNGTPCVEISLEKAFPGMDPGDVRARFYSRVHRLKKQGKIGYSVRFLLRDVEGSPVATIMKGGAG